jgi:hypothetical protein
MSLATQWPYRTWEVRTLATPQIRRYRLPNPAVEAPQENMNVDPPSDNSGEH